MFLAQVGSLNALEQLAKSTVLHEFLGAELPSADTTGRVFTKIDPDSIRRANQDIYAQLKRNKCLELLKHGLIPLNIDGHESHATYNHQGEGCLERTFNKETDNEKTQYHHNHVTAQLVFHNFSLLLDIEPQLPGEGEREAAQRLLKRILADYPRAFDVVVADALYCCAPFINSVVDSGKDIVVVAKDDRFDIVKDAERFFQNKPPDLVTKDKKVERQCWDDSGFLWQEVKCPLRVVKTVETKTIRRQLDGKVMQETSSWMWVTTLPTIRASTKTVVQIGHGRWKIENNGFNEMVNHWYADHVYKHDPAAIINFWLLCVMAFNIFRVFYLRNLKPVVQAACTMLHIACQIASELYCRSVPAVHPP